LPCAHSTALGDLEAVLQGDDSLPLLVRIGLVHAQFETIHPFLDGNGWMGRLITFLLSECGVLQKPVLTLSPYLKRHRQTYDELLQATRDRGAWEEWLAFFLRGVAEVSAQSADTVRRILALREAHRTLIAQKLGRAAGNGHRILDPLYRRPIVSVNEVRALTGTSFVAANGLVGRMVEAGILAETTGHARHRRFRYDAYVDLFTEGEAPPSG
jgi:Fic family protein